MSVSPLLTALRSVGAVLLGYAIIVIAALIFQDALFGRVTHESPLLAIVVGGGMTAVVGGVGGGYLLAQVAPRASWLHAAPLVLWLCFESTLLYLRGNSPLWFDVMAAGSLIAGVIFGVYLWVRRNGVANQSLTNTSASAL